MLTSVEEKYCVRGVARGRACDVHSIDLVRVYRRASVRVGATVEIGV